MGKGTKAFSFSILEESFRAIVCLDSEGQLETMGENMKPVRFAKGRSLFLPAGLRRCLVVGNATVLKIRS